MTLIIDACIARGAGISNSNARSRCCREVLSIVDRSQKRDSVILTPVLHGEWKKHAGTYAVRWLAVMMSRGRVLHRNDVRSADLHEAIAAIEDAGIRAALLKDVHISDAAVMNSCPVVSTDGRQFRYLGMVAGLYPRAGRIQWMNPEVVEEATWKKWLANTELDEVIFRVAPETS